MGVIHSHSQNYRTSGAGDATYTRGQPDGTSNTSIKGVLTLSSCEVRAAKDDLSDPSLLQGCLLNTLSSVHTCDREHCQQDSPYRSPGSTSPSKSGRLRAFRMKLAPHPHRKWVHWLLLPWSSSSTRPYDRLLQLNILRAADYFYLLLSIPLPLSHSGRG